MRKQTVQFALLPACFAALVFSIPALLMAAEWEQNTPYYEDDAWYDISEWLDGNDYNPTDEIVGRWDDETYDWSAIESDFDNDAYTAYGYDENTAQDDWYYDYYNTNEYSYYDRHNGDGIYDHSYRYYDYDNDGYYDALATSHDTDEDALYDEYNFYSFTDPSERTDTSRDSAESQSKTRFQQQQADAQQKQSAKQVQVTGTVEKTKRVKVRNATDRLVAQVASDQGKMFIIDFGPASLLNGQLSQSQQEARQRDPSQAARQSRQPVKQGEQVSARGPVLKVRDKQVLVAESVKIGNQRPLRRFAERQGSGWKYLNMMPVESGRGCPYGCEFCTVTGFFGDSIRFRTNESVVNELLLLKRRARRERGKVSVFFIDDNFAINIKRTKSLLRDIIAAKAQLPWTAQISANLLRDEELVDLIAASGGKWIFIGMESLDEANLSDVNKSFNRPKEYTAVLNRLAKRDIYAITSFIIGLDNDTPGVADRTLQQIELWPPGLPVFSQLTPLPGTPLYARLGAEGRLIRPRHWLSFSKYKMSHTPLKMSVSQTHEELDKAWRMSYSPHRNESVLDLLTVRGLDTRAMHFLMRLFFRGIYVPQMTKRAWLNLILQNRRSIFKLLRQAAATYRETMNANRVAVR